MEQLTTDKIQVLSDTLKQIKFKQTRFLYASPLNVISENKSYCAMGGLAKQLGCSEMKIQLAEWGFIKSVHHFIANKLGFTKEERHIRYQCVDCKRTKPLFPMIIHLNDKHNHTYDEIADILPMLKKA